MKNKAVRESYKWLPCMVCASTPCDPCHIKTYNTTREDKEDNLIPMCRRHHTMQGQKGWPYMWDNFPDLRGCLKRMGFEVQTIFGIRKLVKV